MSAGTYPDGSFGPWRWWSPEGSGASGVTHGLVAGTTGAGKSRLLALKLAYERATPLMVSWVADPQGGQSLPEWVDGVDWYGKTMDEIKIMLHAARALMYDRSKRLAEMEWVDAKGRTRIGRSTFTPTPDMPLINITLDEAHRVLAPGDGDMVDLVDEMARMGRKCGLSLTLATQLPTLGDLQKQSLKGMLAGGNVVILRTGENVSGNIIATQPLPQNPYSLPREIELDDGRKVGTGGLGFSLGGAGRPSLCRVMDLGDEYRWATAGETTALPGDDGQVLEAFAGDAYRNRRDRRRAAVKLEDLTGGSRTTPARPATALHAVPEPAQPAGPDPRAAAVRILRGQDKPLTTNELVRRVETLGCVGVTREVLVKALSRAQQAGEVEQLPGQSFGPDRSARWRAA